MRALVVTLILVWAVLSGYYSTKPLILGFGVASIAFVVWLAVRMDRAAGESGWPDNTLAVGLRMIFYLPKLLWRMVSANVHVARLVLSPRPKIEQRLVLIDTSLESDLARVIYANSITLTPGTVTLDIRDNQVLVHAIDSESLAGLDDGAIESDVAKLEDSAVVRQN